MQFKKFEVVGLALALTGAAVFAAVIGGALLLSYVVQ